METSFDAKRDSVNGKTANEVFIALNTPMAIGNRGDWRFIAVSKSVRRSSCS